MNKFLLEDENEKGILATLTSNFPRKGTVLWVGVRPSTKEPMASVEQVEAIPGEGLTGDRFKGNFESKRQVTFIQAEHLEAVGSFMGLDTAVKPELTRRNILVKGINLFSLKNTRFKVGTAVFEMTGLCYPCSKMEKNFGEGGYNAMRGHGGITTRVVEKGIIHIGDSIEVIEKLSL